MLIISSILFEINLGIYGKSLTKIMGKNFHILQSCNRNFTNTIRAMLKSSKINDSYSLILFHWSPTYRTFFACLLYPVKITFYTMAKFLIFHYFTSKTAQISILFTLIFKMPIFLFELIF